ncbi:hypothetical protein AVEN_60580-1 [Araneus ventricosus]|uniref:Uncharacterized protein n=1 Tax=Araneus ventricosus TaxID=182803 RepID=A0A4Y2F147_ARAVE|nr:hypothetical protein AVEN_60580-1 [Araneus ventricosus]
MRSRPPRIPTSYHLPACLAARSEVEKKKKTTLVFLHQNCRSIPNFGPNWSRGRRPNFILDFLHYYEVKHKTHHIVSVYEKVEGRAFPLFEISNPLLEN